MAVKPTPNNNLYKGLVFDGVDSRNYGIYITGDAVFNSPERDVEMIEIVHVAFLVVIFQNARKGMR